VHALTAGLGLKAEHFQEALSCRAPGLWFEVHAENYRVAGGPRLAWLEAVRAAHPLSLHGVSLSLAGAEPPDAATLAGLAALVRRVEPTLVSEHLAWSRRGPHYLPDLLPFPRSDEALVTICAHVAQVQDALGRPIALENPSHYLTIEGHAWGEIDFGSASTFEVELRRAIKANAHGEEQIGFVAGWRGVRPFRLLLTVHCFSPFYCAAHFASAPACKLDAGADIPCRDAARSL